MYTDIQREQISRFYTSRGLTWNAENNLLSTPGLSSPLPPARDTCAHHEALFDANEKLIRVTYGTTAPKHILPITYEILDLEKGLAKICNDEIPASKK